MKPEAEDAVRRFASEQKFIGYKGRLSMALVVTQHAKNLGLPLDSDALKTENKGQVRGLGRAAVQKVLRRHGIHRTLAKEAGRTSRANLGRMEDYVDLLNDLHHQGGLEHEDLNDVEAIWVGYVREFFASRPFKLKLDAAKGLIAAIQDLLQQARNRQDESPGMTYQGAVLQHLVGAKLEIAMPEVSFDHHSFSTADDQAGRGGDFDIGTTAIHVTVTPTEALIKRCGENIEAGLRPVIVTMSEAVAATSILASNAGIGDAVDIFAIEQFVPLNLYELSHFESAKRKPTTSDLVDRYNRIIDEHETDPSLKIALG